MHQATLQHDFLFIVPPLQIRLYTHISIIKLIILCKSNIFFHNFEQPFYLCSIQNPPTYLKNYKNPCWFENISNSSTYERNSIQQSYEGSSMGSIARQLKTMDHLLIERMRTNGTMGWRLRCLPYFYLAGVSKCGTTDLYNALSRHKDVLGGVRKEPTYWNRIRYHGTLLFLSTRFHINI